MRVVMACFFSFLVLLSPCSPAWASPPVIVEGQADVAILRHLRILNIRPLEFGHIDPTPFMQVEAQASVDDDRRRAVLDANGVLTENGLVLRGKHRRGKVRLWGEPGMAYEVDLPRRIDMKAGGALLRVSQFNVRSRVNSSQGRDGYIGYFGPGGSDVLLIGGTLTLRGLRWDHQLENAGPISVMVPVTVRYQ